MCFFHLNVFFSQIENLQEQLRDKEKQMSSLKERVKSLQADTTNTDTALTTLEEALAEKVSDWPRFFAETFILLSCHLKIHYKIQKKSLAGKEFFAVCDRDLI